MKRRVFVGGAVAALALLTWTFAQAPVTAPPAPSQIVPPGPLLYLEAKDFGTLLRDWNASQEKQLWTKSANFDVFSRSRLYLKLNQAQTEFAAAAGLPPDMDLLNNVAGGQSAIALYDIGKLEFLYVTRMRAERFAGGALWKTRGSYQPRQSSGLDYYIKTDADTRRVVAFAVAKDYVLLATREDVLAGALALLAGQPGSSVANEPWFDRTVHAAKSPGELRMVMNFDKLSKSPHFRSYWIQQNLTELKQYSAAIADAGRGSNDFHEDRVLLRGSEMTPNWNETATGEVVRYAPAAAGVYRAWASPSSEQAFDLLRRKLLEPHPDSRVPSKTAPGVTLGSGEVGSEGDLETRIDEPPLETGAQPTAAELRKLLDATQLDAMLQVASTRVQQDNVFVTTDTGLAFLAASDWDSTAVRNAVTAVFARLLTTDGIGVHWQERRTGANVYYEFDGLAPIAVATQGRVLLIATGKDLLQAMLAGPSSQPAAPGARYAARYRHSAELPNFVKLMRLIDTPLGNNDAQQSQSEPPFFSSNLASFGQALGRIDTESIVVHDTGATVMQTVIYGMK